MTSKINELLNLPPYCISNEKKQKVLLAAVQEALLHHYKNCAPFHVWCKRQGFDPTIRIKDLKSIPFLPVNIFKRMDLKSVPESEIVRVLSSSGTSSQIPSRVVLDRITRDRQIRTLVSILSDVIGSVRKPFILLEVPSSSGCRKDIELPARIAGLRGYLVAASETIYVLKNVDQRLYLDVDLFLETLNNLRDSRSPFCILGYTYILYQYVVKPLYENRVNFELPDSTWIIHFGGWKKLQDQSVDKTKLNNMISNVFGLPVKRICDIYGFTEQLGVIYPDDSNGIKRTPVYSEVFVRDPVSLEIVPDGELGFLEFVTPLYHSYPGIALLVDDMGRIVTRKPDSNGKYGTGFEVVGRAERAEVRGCGDTLPSQVYQIGNITNRA